MVNTIQQNINALKESSSGNNNDEENTYEAKSHSSAQFGHIQLGTPQKPLTVTAVEQQASSNVAFTNFQQKLSNFVEEFYDDQLIAFTVLILVWLCELFTLIRYKVSILPIFRAYLYGLCQDFMF